MTDKTKGEKYSEVTPALIEQVKEVLADADKHTYSVSKVYAAYNEVFGLKEMPRSCGSCLQDCARRLRSWLAEYETPRPDDAGSPANEGGANEAQTDAESKLPFGAEGTLPKGVTRYPMPEGMPIDFTPDEDSDVKGTVKYADGSKVKAGTYTTVNGLQIAVQPGGKANIKDEDLT